MKRREGSGIESSDTSRGKMEGSEEPTNGGNMNKEGRDQPGQDTENN